MLRIISWGLVALFAMSAQAMTIEVMDDKVFVTGGVGGDDYRDLKAVFDNQKITTVVFVNSPGGDLWTGLNVGRMISDKGYKTVTVGFCHSACSLMFMGGTERRFGDALRPAFNVIGLHGPHDIATKRVSPTQAPQMYAFYKQQMGDKFNTDIMNQALYEMEDSGSLLRVFETTRNDKAQTYHCRSVQTLRSQCTTYKDHNGMTLGVLTHAELATVVLPVKMRQAHAVLGKELGTEDFPAIVDIKSVTADLAANKCLSPMCKRGVEAYAERKDHKAMAFRSNYGFGAQWNADTAIAAMVRAVYQCNHLATLPVALCEAHVVNDFDVRGIYAQSVQEHRAALAKLSVPKNRFYGNEEFGGGFTTANGYRTQKWHDMTPRQIDGIETIGTQALVSVMLSDKPPIVIDVWGASNDAIASSKLLVNGGSAFDNVAAEQAFNQRFVNLLSHLAPDKLQPIVFYCQGRECWLSVNASIRAKAAGYTNVWWYRGGYAAWKEAQLPTALVAVRAVAN